MKNPVKGSIDAYDDYAQAVDRMKIRFEAAGIDVSEGLVARQALLDPRVPNLLSGTREQYLKAPTATVETASTRGAPARSPRASPRARNSPIEQLFSAALGRSPDVTRIDRSGYGTFEPYVRHDA